MDRLRHPGGHLVLSVPADPERFGPMDIHAGHYRRYSQDGISTLASSAGLVDIAVIPYGAPLGYALEAVRNRLDAKKLAKARAAGLRPENLTAASGRTFQFDRRSWKSVGATVATTPFKYLQQVWPVAQGWWWGPTAVVVLSPPGRRLGRAPATQERGHGGQGHVAEDQDHPRGHHQGEGLSGVDDRSQDQHQDDIPNAGSARGGQEQHPQRHGQAMLPCTQEQSGHPGCGLTARANSPSWPPTPPSWPATTPRRPPRSAGPAAG